MSLLFLFGIALGLDNFRVALALGSLNLKQQHRLKIAFAFYACEALAPLLGLKIGSALIGLNHLYVEAVGPILLGATGLFVIYRSLKGEEPGDLFAGDWLLFGLPISLSLDNLVAGAGLGMLGVPILTAAIAIGTISGTMCLIGFLLGGLVARHLPPQAEMLSGICLLLFALILVLGP